jgi:hypothetical protein
MERCQERPGGKTMRRRDRILFVVLTLVLLGSFRVGQQLFRWYAFSEERVELARLEAALEEEALGIVSTRLDAETLRRRVEVLDSELRERRQQLDASERQLVTLRPERSSAVRFQTELELYNQRVGERNSVFGDWRNTLLRNQEHVWRYNILVDSIRAAAERMGEPFYPIRTPAEIAATRGVGEADP